MVILLSEIEVDEMSRHQWNVRISPGFLSELRSFRLLQCSKECTFHYFYKNSVDYFCGYYSFLDIIPWNYVLSPVYKTKVNEILT